MFFHIFHFFGAGFCSQRSEPLTSCDPHQQAFAAHPKGSPGQDLSRNAQVLPLPRLHGSG